MTEPLAIYEQEPCQGCGGSGYNTQRAVVGHVTHDMAIDAGIKNIEGSPVYGEELVPCEYCNGTGIEVKS